MDSLITAAARALAAGDPLGALKRIALRDDPPALALRGIAMAQLGDLVRAKVLLRRAARGFGPKEPVARARCVVAEAEIALAARELKWSAKSLEAARMLLEEHGDRANAAQARYLEVRRLVLIGRLDEADKMLAALDPGDLPPALRAVHELAIAGVATRRLRITVARTALAEAQRAARKAGIPALTVEVENAARVLTTPAARVIADGTDRLLLLEDVEALHVSGALIVDACRLVVRNATTAVSLGRRPVLFALARALGEAWPLDVSRDALVARAFRGKRADESYRARLRVEVGRLRRELRKLTRVSATRRGFALAPREQGASWYWRRRSRMRTRRCSAASPMVSQVELGARARSRNGSTHDAALARGAGGGRQGAGIRPRAGAPLDDSPSAGIHDDFVTPGANLVETRMHP